MSSQDDMVVSRPHTVQNIPDLPSAYWMVDISGLHAGPYRGV